MSPDAESELRILCLAVINQALKDLKQPRWSKDRDDAEDFFHDYRWQIYKKLMGHLGVQEMYIRKIEEMVR